jgi:hypothetical protein
MPIMVTDDDGNAVDIDKVDGGTLRKRYVETHQQNEKLTERLVTLEAQAAIQEHGSTLVKVEDLAGVPVEKISDTVKSLHEKRETERQDLIRSVFAEKGLDGNDLDQAVSDFIGAQSSQEENWPGTDNLGGERPSRNSKLPPMDDAMGNLQSAFSNERSKK